MKQNILVFIITPGIVLAFFLFIKYVTKITMIKSAYQRVKLTQTEIYAVVPKNYIQKKKKFEQKLSYRLKI